jgi:hypothetical protein
MEMQALLGYNWVVTENKPVERQAGAKRLVVVGRKPEGTDIAEVQVSPEVKGVGEELAEVGAQQEEQPGGVITSFYEIKPRKKKQIG